MDKEEVMKHSCTVKETNGNKVVEVTKNVLMKFKKKLLHVLWWHKHEVSLRASMLEFDIFVDTIAANMARTAVKIDADRASTVTVKQVNDFQRGHRRNL
eukprot:8343423-Ditylum_brightwellii.AAC.1